jgi:hypothetical protein
MKSKVNSKKSVFFQFLKNFNRLLEFKDIKDEKKNQNLMLLMS